MEHLNVECDLQSLRKLYSLLLFQSNANKEYVPQAFLLDDNSQCLLKRLLDSATEELLARQHKVLAQAQLGLQERVSTPSNSVSRGIAKLPSKAGLTHEVVDSIELIETQLSAFQFCSSRGDTTRSCMEEEDYSSSAMPFQRLNERALVEPRQSYLRSRQMSQTTIAPSLRSLNNTRVRSRYDPTLALHSQVSSSPDGEIVLATSRPPRPMRSVGFEKPRQSNRTSHKMASMKPTLLLDQGTETGTSSESEEQVSYTDQESEGTVSTSVSSWETHGESLTESDSSYPSESNDDDDEEESSQVSDSPPRNRSRKKATTGRLKRFKDKLGKVFHHHHYHHHHHKEEEQGRKPSAWKQLVKKHLQKDKEKQVEKRMKTESKGLTTHNNNKGGQFQTLVKGFMRHHRRHSKNKKKKMQTPKRQGGGVKFPKRARVKLEKTNYLCNKDQEHDEN